MPFDFKRLEMDARAAQARGQDPVSVILAVEPGHVEWRAQLAILSVLTHVVDPLRIVAACRHDRIDELRPETRAFLDATATLTPVELDLAEDAPLFVKIAAGAQAGAGDRLIYLEPEVLFLTTTRLGAAMAPGALSAAPQPAPNWPEAGVDADAVWRALYKRFDLDGPTVFFGSSPQRLDWPLFNRGFYASCGGDFPALWLDTALSLAKGPDAPPTAQIDQIAAPLAAARAGMPLARLSRHWNGLCKAPVARNEERRMIRYHNAERLRENGFVADVDEMLSRRSDFDDFAAFLEATAPEISKSARPADRPPGLRGRIARLLRMRSAS